MKTERFIELMGEEWAKEFSPFIESRNFDTILETLKKDSKKGKIFPESKNTFKAFQLVQPKNLNLVMIGIEPFEDKEYMPSGLLLSTNNDKQHPHLKKILEKIANEEKISTEQYDTSNLEYLAEQGVLLISKSLTVIENEKGSHKNLWIPFWKYYFHNIHDKSIPILTLGIKNNPFELDNKFKIYNLTQTEYSLAAINVYLRDIKNVAIKFCKKTWLEHPVLDIIDSNGLPF